MFNVSGALKLAKFTFYLILAMDIHRNTSDILFTTENIENIMRSIEDKQDRFIAHFEQREEAMMAELREVSERITATLNSLKSLSSTFDESVSSLQETIQGLASVMLAQEQARLLAQQVRFATN